MFAVGRPAGGHHRRAAIHHDDNLSPGERQQATRMFYTLYNIPIDTSIYTYAHVGVHILSLSAQ